MTPPAIAPAVTSCHPLTSAARMKNARTDVSALGPAIPLVNVHAATPALERVSPCEPCERYSAADCMTPVKIWTDCSQKCYGSGERSWMIVAQSLWCPVSTKCAGKRSALSDGQWSALQRLACLNVQRGAASGRAWREIHRAECVVRPHPLLDLNPREGRPAEPKTRCTDTANSRNRACGRIKASRCLCS